MTAHQLAPSSMKEKRAKEAKWAREAARSDLTIGDGATDAFLCEACAEAGRPGRRCVFFQQQTRGADEPMTIFGQTTRMLQREAIRCVVRLLTCVSVLLCSFSDLLGLRQQVPQWRRRALINKSDETTTTQVLRLLRRLQLIIRHKLTHNLITQLEPSNSSSSQPNIRLLLALGFAHPDFACLTLYLTHKALKWGNSFAIQ